jgi:hypothetical protein
MTFRKFTVSLQSSDVARFVSKVDRKSNDECWQWIAGTFKSKNGHYGSFHFNGNDWLAHRVAYFQANNIDPGDKEVCHKCDNTLCVNPSHLFLGEHIDNIRDMLCKNRYKDTKGESNPKAKLTNEDVREIRTLPGSASSIAHNRKMAISSICRIRNRTTWKHVA